LSDPLDRWLYTRRHPELWRAHLASREPLRAASLALIDPHEPERMVQALIDAQAWEAAELLLDDELFLEGADPDALDDGSQRLRRAKAEALAAWRLRFEALADRARMVGLPLNITHKPGADGALDDSVLDELANKIEVQEVTQRAELKREAKRLADQHSNPEDATRWLDEILRLIDQDTPRVNELILGGPTSTPLTVSFPTPASQQLKGRDLRELLATLLGEQPGPSAIWRPPASATTAWRMMEALYRPRTDEGDVVIRCLASLLDTAIDELHRDADGWTGRLHDLSAPGFLALGRQRWPQGVPVWLPMDPEAIPPSLARGGLLIRLVLEGRPPELPGQLLLDLREVLATLTMPPKARRDAVLATLGAQIPLDQLYTFQEADPSSAWVRALPLPRPDPDDPRPLLISGAPGLGKSVLLKRLAKEHNAAIVAATDELPERDCILVDCIESIGEREARNLVRSIHWIADQDPPPFVVVVAPPGSAAKLRAVRSGFFKEQELEPPTHLQARNHIRSLLGWGGLCADRPYLYDELVALSACNPSALHALARALAEQIRDEAPPGERTFAHAQIERAWVRPALRERLHALFWEPLIAEPGAFALAQALTLFAQEGDISSEDLRWAFGECGGVLDDAGWERLLKLFMAHGLIKAPTDGRLHLPPTGPGRLLADWSSRSLSLESHSQVQPPREEAQ